MLIITSVIFLFFCNLQMHVWRGEELTNNKNLLKKMKHDIFIPSGQEINIYFLNLFKEIKFSVDI